MTAFALAFASIVSRIPFGTLTFLLPIYGRQLGASASQIGSPFPALAFVLVGARPMLDPALDRYARRPFPPHR
ncbi:MAG: hypothetical protein P1P76_00105 [Anaerolineales bacterium]|nr:hypothetical protein [Anaerolineales bacterium]